MQCPKCERPGGKFKEGRMGFVRNYNELLPVMESTKPFPVRIISTNTATWECKRCGTQVLLVDERDYYA